MPALGLSLRSAVRGCSAPFLLPTLTVNSPVSRSTLARRYEPAPAGIVRRSMRIPVIHLRNAAISAFMSACTAALCAGSALAASSDTVGVLPTPAPLRSTTSAAKPARVHAFVAGDVSFGTRVYNELAPGATGESMFETKGALTDRTSAFSPVRFWLSDRHRRRQRLQLSRRHLSGC
jgi:hypothetical protein